ncbi:23S rRNA (pseudouridine(1915)-N(3))-methyltransferase RlmH [Rhodobacteraceae bacterium CCMM004]|nr:23S rRNA (pseudouridine(1915)-N(3))-methyltransferase RlmH [Rhodobacteraceae bacterium CCMM004]
MKVTICAVGRLKSGPEAALVADYAQRFGRTGRPLGLGPLDIQEIDDRKGGGPAAEAALLRRAVPQGAVVCALDERGRQMTSPAFADTLAGWRDGGRAAAAFLIGGADGLDPALVAEADLRLSFGAMVWPHKLARAMLAEQLYRAASILAGAPYHRG